MLFAPVKIHLVHCKRHTDERSRAGAGIERGRIRRIAHYSLEVGIGHLSNDDAEVKPAILAKGRVTNGGTTTVSPPWYVEAQLYTDASFSTKLGGNFTSISVPLSPTQTTFWAISFSTSSVDVRSFPNSKVRDLRAIYKR